MQMRAVLAVVVVQGDAVEAMEKAEPKGKEKSQAL